MGRYIDRCKHPLRVFAALEVGIGLFALFFPTISANLGNAYGALVGLQGNFYLFSLARFGLCFALLLIPTALMGGTLPVMAKFAVRRLGRLGGRVGQLYAVNTLGAVVGVLAATFGLMEGLGLRGDDASHRCGEFHGGGRGLAVGETTICRCWRRSGKQDRAL